MACLAPPVLGSFGFVGKLQNVAHLSEQDLADLSRCCQEELTPQVHLVDVPPASLPKRADVGSTPWPLTLPTKTPPGCLIAARAGVAGGAQLIADNQDRFVYDWYGSPSRRAQTRVQR